MLIFSCFLLLLYVSIFSSHSIVANTIASNKSITDGETMASPGGVFELGFVGNESRYLGVWYKNISNHKIVWVENKDRPFTDSSGVLRIDSHGNLVLVDRNGSRLWPSNISSIAPDSVAELLDSGNLILSNNNSANPDSYLWQSFDFPSNTLLPGMKLGWTLNDGLNRYLTSWKSETDPSQGEFTVGFENHLLPQIVVRKRSIKYNRIGPYNGISFSGAGEFRGVLYKLTPGTHARSLLKSARGGSATQSSPIVLHLNSGVAFVREAGMSDLSPSGTQGVSLPAHPSLSSSTIASTTPNLFPATMWRPTTPPFPGHPGLVGAPATPGPPGIPPSGSLPSTTSIHPITPAMPAQQQLYPTFHSPPTMPPHTQGHWFQPPQIAGMQRPPYLPYPAVISNPFPLPVRGLALPSVSLPGSHPPGVSPVGPIGGTPSASEHTRSFVMHSELPPPGTDLDKRASGDGVAVNNEEVDAWTAHKTDTGAVYYYNAVTAESTYERPHNFKGEADKVTVQPTPISWEKLAGTDWTSVTTDDGKKYYYNTKTKVSSWQIPVEVTELWKKKQEEDLLRTNTMLMQDSTTLPEKGSGSISLSTPSVNTGGRDATALRPVLPGSSSALDSIKKKLQDSGIPVTSSPLRTSSGPTTPDVNGLSAVDATIKAPQGENSKDKQDANGNMSDSSSDSEDVDSGPTMEECNIKFKEMLKERGVAPFSKWDKELPKIVFDPRFKAVPSHSARRSLFEHYVRTRAEEERKEKRAAQKAAVEGFRQLLEEASEDIDYKTEYQSFKKKWGSDPRFEALDRKEREVLLNERVLPLKRAAEEKIKAIREAAASSFKSMLRDKREIDSHSRWSRVKDSLRSDPRYKSVKHEDREVLFNEYISELRAVEDEVQRAAKAKREEQDKLKERERETRKRKEREEQEMERVRLKVRRKEAVSSYQALLVETIKDPQASWTESKPKLGKDPQGRATTSDLDQADTEKLFREHVKTLFERCTREFQTLLAEVITTEAAAQVSEDAKSALTSWSTAKRVLKPDPRYSKMPRKDRESLWRRYAEEFQQKRKSASEPVGDKLNAEKRGRNSLDSGSPAVSRRVRERR